VAAEALGLPADTPIEVVSLPCSPTEKRFSADVIEAVERAAQDNDCRPSVVALDTFAASVEGQSLNDDVVAGAAMAAFHRIASHLGCSFVVVHHSGKDQDRAERGSKVIRDRADASIRLAAKNDGSTILTVEKMRNGQSGAHYALRFASRSIQANGNVIETLVLDSVELLASGMAKAAPRKSLTGDPATALSVIQDAGGSMAEEDWRRETRQRLKVTGRGNRERSDKAVREALSHCRKELERRGYAEFADGVVRVRSQKASESVRNAFAPDAGERQKNRQKTTPFRGGSDGSDAPAGSIFYTAEEFERTTLEGVDLAH
jgi:hypothetical protein